MTQVAGSEAFDREAKTSSIADDLMLCVDVGSVIEKLREDQATLRILSAVTIGLEDGLIQQTMQNAFATRPSSSTSLPGQVFATFLIEVARIQIPVWNDDFWLSL